MADLLQQVRGCVQRLESEPDMRKGRLIEAVLGDSSIDWDHLFRSMHLRGRHRTKLRWRRAVITECIRRPFLRGGSRRSACPPAPPRSHPEEPGSPVPRIAAFTSESVWDHFRTVFPVLALYRSGWLPPAGPLVNATDPPPLGWELLWSAHAGSVPVDAIARSLGWPPELFDVLHLVLPLARRLWPIHVPVAATGVTPCALPYVRRAACLLHGFQLGGCAPRGVWEAIKLPSRVAV